MQVLYLDRALRTKETLPDFLKWRRVTRHPLVFRRLTGSQRTPGIGASQSMPKKEKKKILPESSLINPVKNHNVGLYNNQDVFDDHLRAFQVRTHVTAFRRG